MLATRSGSRPDATLKRGHEPALQLEGLSKRFGATIAVDHVSLVVPSGSFYGLVGPNGAGKTTALSMATGLLRPDRGSARIFGVDIWADASRAKALLGVLPDGLSMPERLTGHELLTYTGLLRGLDAQTVGYRADELLAVLKKFADIGTDEVHLIPTSSDVEQVRRVGDVVKDFR